MKTYIIQIVIVLMIKSNEENTKLLSNLSKGKLGVFTNLMNADLNINELINQLFKHNIIADINDEPLINDLQNIINSLHVHEVNVTFGESILHSFMFESSYESNKFYDRLKALKYNLIDYKLSSDIIKVGGYHFSINEIRLINFFKETNRLQIINNTK